MKDAYRFVFDCGSPPSSSIAVFNAEYSEEHGYGFDFGSQLQVERVQSSVREEPGASIDPLFFSVRVPEGNYRVTMTFRGVRNGGGATVRVESRRLMLRRIKLGEGEYRSSSFVVHVSSPVLPSGARVLLKPRELRLLQWDEKLTFEIHTHDAVLCAIEVGLCREAITLYLMGDCTVADQPHEPWSGWGQILPCFFTSTVAVANYAAAGESARSSIDNFRLAKVVSMIRPGDYLMIQFGHNDMKQTDQDAGAFRSFQRLLRHYVEEIRTRGATPVLLTPVHRRTFDENGRIYNSLGDFPEAMRQVARETGAPLIDLHEMSRIFYEALGESRSLCAFVGYPASVLPGYRGVIFGEDKTHHNTYGSYELARCVVEGIKSAGLGLAAHLTSHRDKFVPHEPDAPESLDIPPSPSRSMICSRLLTKPQGVSQKAWKMFLSGIRGMETHEPDRLSGAIECFVSALGEDPLFGLAHNGLANARMRRATLAPGRAELEGGDLRQAWQDVCRAIELSPGMADCYLTSAKIARLRWDWEWTVQGCRKALKMDPILIRAQSLSAELCAQSGDLEAALNAITTAVLLDPFDVESYRVMGLLLLHAGKYRRAIRNLERLTMDYSRPELHVLLGDAYALLAQSPVKATPEELFQKADDQVRTILALASRANVDTDGWLALADRMMASHVALRGHHKAARAFLPKLESAVQRGILSPVELARVYSVLGEDQAARTLLQEALAHKHQELWLVGSDPFFERVRDAEWFAPVVASTTMAWNHREFVDLKEEQVD